MPERVVDLLEAVEVEHQHGRAPGRTVLVAESLPDSIEDERSVRQVGQRVMRGLVLQPLLLAQRLGHILKEHDPHGSSVRAE